jgi:hypothetical protein
MKKGGQERVIDIHFADGRATYDIKYVLLQKYQLDVAAFNASDESNETK